EMANRHLEFELFSAVGASWVNSAALAQMLPGRFKHNPQAKAGSDAVARAFYKRLDNELANHRYMADDAYSIADITALCVIDFASALVDLRPDDSLEHLWRWHHTVSARPSAKA